MRVGDRVADGEEEADALVDPQPLPGAELVDRLTVDQFDDDVGEAVLGGSAVEEPRDVGMLEGGQHLALGAETPQGFGRRPATADELDRHLLAERVVGPFRQVHRAHAAAAELVEKAIRPDPVGDPRALVVADQDRRPVAVEAGAEIVAGGGRRRQQRLDLGPQPGLAGALGGEQSPPWLGVQLERAGEELRDAASPGGVACAAVVRSAPRLGAYPLRSSACAPLPRTSR